MFNTVAAIVVVLILVLPGFIIADLAEARRAHRAARSDWELVLRALTYALVLQAVVLITGWTTWLIDTTKILGKAAPGSDHVWEHHRAAIGLYIATVIVIVPTLLGLLLGWVLRRAEGRGSLTWIHYALGGRDARQAWDYAFQRFGKGFVLVHLKPGAPGRSSFLVGKYGLSSWAGQTPTDQRDVYFEEVWPALPDGQITKEFAVTRGMWIGAQQIDAMFFIDPPDARRSWWTRLKPRLQGSAQRDPAKKLDS